MKNFKPILFSTPMVQAILEGRKTQTRRVIKPQPTLINDNVHLNWNGNYYLTREQMLEKAPMLPGTILWVRETVKVGAWNEDEGKMAFDYKASPELKKTPWCHFEDFNRFDKIFHKTLDELDLNPKVEPVVDDENEMFWYKWEPGESPLKWKPSIFMPKEACRIFLEVTNVRVERLQDISEPDAVAEGVRYWSDENDTDLLDAIFKNYVTGERNLVSSYSSFRSLWLSINGEESWDANPWVWVYDFKRIEKPEDFL